jgi:3',5'-cyclic AMP phosphodiesterase CpdA
MKSYFFALPGLFFVLSACQPSDQAGRAFIHNIVDGPKPWSAENFEAGEVDFTFAIIADLTGGEREGIFNVAVAQINRIEPDFVLSVGDLIEGGTRDTIQLNNEWDSFDARVGQLDMPFFHLGGNHDLSNPVMQRYWQRRIGPLYYHFLIDNVLFLMLDSEDFEKARMLEIDQARTEAIKMLQGEIEGEYTKSTYYHMPERKTGALSSAQQDYFEKVISENKDVRWTFVLMHKPLWTRTDEKGLNRIINTLGDRPFTVINGHEHSFSYREIEHNDYLMLGTTGGYQSEQDPNAFDHITLVRMAAAEPVITHIRLDGILDEKGMVPAGGDSLCFQASRCL